MTEVTGEVFKIQTPPPPYPDFRNSEFKSFTSRNKMIKFLKSLIQLTNDYTASGNWNSFMGRNYSKLAFFCSIFTIEIVTDALLEIQTQLLLSNFRHQKKIIKKKNSLSTVIKKARFCLIKQSIHNKTKRRQKHHSPKPNPW